MDIPFNLTSKLPTMAPSSTSANTNQTDPLQHPLQATAMAIGGAIGERRSNRMSHMASANEGPADIIAKVSGAVQGGTREDDGAYFTSNEGIPFPDPSVTRHSSLEYSLLMPYAARTARLLAVFRLPAMCSCSSKRASTGDVHQSRSHPCTGSSNTSTAQRTLNVSGRCLLSILYPNGGIRGD